MNSLLRCLRSNNKTLLNACHLAAKYNIPLQLKLDDGKLTRLLYKQPSYLFSTSTRFFNEREEDSKNNEGKNDGKEYSVVAGLLALVLLATGYIYRTPNNRPQISWKEFIEDILPSGEVDKIIVNPRDGNHSLLVVTRPNATYKGNRFGRVLIQVNNISDVNRAEEAIRNVEKELGIHPHEKVPIVYTSFDPDFLLLVPMLFLSIALLVYFTRRLSLHMGISGASVTPKQNKVATGVAFADVAGNTEAKKEVMELVHFLKFPEKYEKLGAKMPRGCLLTGPPGVGKTLLAKAVATEADVPFIFKAGSDFVEMIGGLGAKRVRDLFKEARADEPCIIYIDELDAVGGKRSGANNFNQGTSEKDQTLNQILVEMDGMFSSNYNIIVMASTNRADMLDKALLRPGRFDRLIDIDLPTRAERKEIFEQHLKGLKLLKASENYSTRLASLSPGMSGADIANICNEAAIYAAREKDSHIDAKHFEYAVERILGGARRKTSSISATERQIIAIHESGRVLVGWMLKATDAPIKVSIIPRTKGSLGYVGTMPTENKLFSPAQLFDYMSMNLGGRAAENLVLGTVSESSENSLKKVTDMAYAQVKHLGFSSSVGNISFADQDETYVKPYSEDLASLMDEEARKLIYRAHKHAEKILKENRDKLKLLSEELLKREVLDYDDIVALIGPPTHEKIHS